LEFLVWDVTLSLSDFSSYEELMPEEIQTTSTSHVLQVTGKGSTLHSSTYAYWIPVGFWILIGISGILGHSIYIYFLHNT